MFLLLGFFKGKKKAEGNIRGNQAQLWIFHFYEHMLTRDYCVINYHIFTLKTFLRSSKWGCLMDLLQNVVRAACDGHTHMDGFKISYILHVAKAWGLSFLGYFLHQKWFSGTSIMAWFLFKDTDIFLFSEIKATAKWSLQNNFLARVWCFWTASQLRCFGQSLSRSQIKPVVPYSITTLQGGRSLHVIANTKTKGDNYTPVEM